MRFVRLIVLALTLGLLTLTTTGCGAGKTNNVVTNADEVMRTPLGATLAKLGYTPLLVHRYDGKFIGYTFGVCLSGNLTKCADEMSDKTEASKPSLRTDASGKVITLIGPDYKDKDRENYRLKLPKGGYQDFVKMNPTQRLAVLGLMKTAISKFDSKVTEDQRMLLPPVGPVVVYIN